VTAGEEISILSASGQLIAGVATAVAPIGGPLALASLALNPAAGLITLVKIGTDASNTNQVNVGDAISVVDNSISIGAAIIAVVPGGQPLALSMLVIGKAMALGGLLISALDVNFPLNIISPTLGVASRVIMYPFVAGHFSGQGK
jgi:uncharacterized membrane protein YccF (DUF307 family)